MEPPTVPVPDLASQDPVLQTSVETETPRRSDSSESSVVEGGWEDVSVLDGPVV